MRLPFTVAPGPCPAELTPERRRAFRDGLERRCAPATRSWRPVASSLDAVVAAVQVLEDDPLFNAGRGAVLTADGAAELDASIMDGRDLRAGASRASATCAIPIELARRVMDHSPHVMLAGPGRRRIRARAGHGTGAERVFRPPSGASEELARHLRGATRNPGEEAAARAPSAPSRSMRRQPRRRHLHRRHDRQKLGTRRRLADHRRRHLRGERLLRGLGHRPRRILHPRGRRA